MTIIEELDSGNTVGAHVEYTPGTFVTIQEGNMRRDLSLGCESSSASCPSTVALCNTSRPAVTLGSGQEVVMQRREGSGGYSSAVDERAGFRLSVQRANVNARSASVEASAMRFIEVLCNSGNSNSPFSVPPARLSLFSDSEGVSTTRARISVINQESASSSTSPGRISIINQESASSSTRPGRMSIINQGSVKASNYSAVNSNTAAITHRSGKSSLLTQPLDNRRLIEIVRSSSERPTRHELPLKHCAKNIASTTCRPAATLWQKVAGKCKSAMQKLGNYHRTRR
jgi:hypothetical protein